MRQATNVMRHARGPWCPPPTGLLMKFNVDGAVSRNNLTWVVLEVCRDQNNVTMGL